MALSGHSADASEQARPARTISLERVLRKERLIVAGSVLLIVSGAVWYTVAGVGMQMSAVEMTRMAGPIGQPMPMGAGAVWTLWYAALVFAMWWVMMVAMMIPSAAPTILLYARVYRHSQKQGQIKPGLVPTASFLLGYLLAWLAFSVVATVLQWLLEQLGLVHGMMMWSTNHLLSAGFLVGAGLYQFTNLKDSCLSHCRSPASWISSNWRPGHAGALIMGLRHGAYCLGCCIPLMLLLFVGGTMNLVWIAGLAVLVLLEKLLSPGRWLARASGVVLTGAGLYLLLP